MAACTFGYAASTGVNLALVSAWLDATRYGSALNSATSAESVRATGCGSSMLSFATMSFVLTALIASQAACLFLLFAVMYQQVPGPPTVKDGPPLSVGWRT
jgi:hypothetical protein